METIKKRLNHWLRDKTGATFEIANLRANLDGLRQQFSACRLRLTIAQRNHDKEVARLKAEIISLRTQEPLARMLDTQRNKTQQQEIRDLRKENQHLRRKLSELA